MLYSIYNIKLDSSPRGFIISISIYKFLSLGNFITEDTLFRNRAGETVILLTIYRRES